MGYPLQLVAQSVGFGRPRYLVTLEDKLRNYVIGHDELGLDLAPVLRHFAECLPEERVVALAEQALGGRWTGSAFICEPDPVHREKGSREHVSQGASLDRDVRASPRFASRPARKGGNTLGRKLE